MATASSSSSVPQATPAPKETAKAPPKTATSGAGGSFVAVKPGTGTGPEAQATGVVAPPDGGVSAVGHAPAGSTDNDATKPKGTQPSSSAGKTRSAFSIPPSSATSGYTDYIRLKILPNAQRWGLYVVAGLVALAVLYSGLPRLYSTIPSVRNVTDGAQWAASFLRSCERHECCAQPWVRLDTKEINARSSLYGMLQQSLFGQEIAITMISYSVNGHINNPSPGRPLVLSLHGSQGIGKSYTTTILARFLFKKGTESEYVMRVQCSNAAELEGLAGRIKAQLKKCPRSLFVFDDLEKAASLGQDALNSLYPLIQNNYPPSRRAIFIFISNTGEQQIGEVLTQMNINRQDRVDIDKQHLKTVLKEAAYRDDSSLKNSWLIDNSLINHYVPFLQLEKAQIELCIREELAKRRLPPNEKDIPNILAQMNFLPGGLWSEDGCRPVENLVNEEVERHRERVQAGVEQTFRAEL